MKRDYSLASALDFTKPQPFNVVIEPEGESVTATGAMMPFDPGYEPPVQDAIGREIAYPRNWGRRMR